MRKGQVQSQVFVFIIGLIIVSMVLLLGYKMINFFGKNAKEVNYEQFKSDLIGEISKISDEYGSLHKVDIIVPVDFTDVCFINSNITTVNPDDISDPLIRDSVESKTESNVFLMDPKLKETLFINNMETEEPLLCFENDGKIKITIEGMGDHALLKTPEP